MTAQKTAAAKAAQPLDADAIATALRSEDEGKAKKDAREAVKAMTGTWEHLPVRVRAAIRGDIGRFLTAGKSRAEIIDAGYSAITADRALRDLGIQG